MDKIRQLNGLKYDNLKILLYNSIFKIWYDNYSSIYETCCTKLMATQHKNLITFETRSSNAWPEGSLF